MKTALTKKRRYMSGIDGLRALAVIGVILYHLNYEWLPGGFLGVTIFFVLSGYLITDLLFEEWNQKGKIDIIDFWFRRARRLLPAFLFFMFILTVWILFFHPEAVGKLQADFLPSILYIINWWYIFKDISYFETFGMSSPFTHLWSLAVEEQFYLFWPLLFFFILIIFKKNSLRVLVIFLFIFLSAFLMADIYTPGEDPSRVYYGTDTRSYSLLIGSVLAIFWPSQKLSKTLPALPRLCLEIAGLLGLVMIIIMFYFSNQYENFLYQGGMVLLSIYTALLIACLAHPATFLGKLFSLSPLRWIGTRSYAIYLWHYPIIILTTPNLYSGEIDRVLIFLQLTATFIIAEISYRLIETPFRKGVYQQWLKPRLNPKIYQRGAVFIGVLVFYLFMSGTTYAIISKVEHEPVSVSGTYHSLKHTNLIAKTIPDAQKMKNIQQEQKSITIIGDSIIYDVIPHFKKVYPSAIIDYSVGRQMADVPEVINKLRANGQLGNHIVLEIGTNGPFPDAKLHEVLDMLHNAEKIYLVNTRVPRPWQNIVNETLQKVASERENVVLVDWYQASKNQPSYFTADGVHLTIEGGKAYAELLVAHIQRQ